jgi:Phytanoyl-CoA dioxygenase (PhyH)
MDLPSLLNQDGVFVRAGVVSDDVVADLRRQFTPSSGDPGKRGFALTGAAIALIDSSGPMGALAADAAGHAVRPVRVLFFDKTQDANWAVPWHQDRCIAVKSRAELDGYGPWSVKNGVDRVEPPVAVRDGMVTLRLFVDDCGSDNGPLLVARGSHRHGRIPGRDIAEVVSCSEIFVGTGQAGDVLVMRTLAIHSSKRAALPAHRRVLHVDYAAAELPPPLEWKLN